MRRLYCLFLIVPLSLQAAFCGMATCTSDPKLVFPDVTWTQIEPAQAGWSAEELQAAKVYAQSIGTMSWVLIENGKIIDSFGPLDRLNSLHSARKSLLSAMYGQAVSDGKINLSMTIEQLRIDDNAPSLTRNEKQATLRELLMARSGIYHEALGETPEMKEARPQRGSHQHGTFWYYNNWDFNVLGTVFNQLTGESLFDFFDQRIAIPLRMEDYKVEKQQYIAGPESIHRYYNFELSARDMARFGLLFLSDGCWHSKQIIPAGWVKETTTPYSDTVSKFMPQGMGQYGYLWWITAHQKLIPNTTLPDGSYAALGAGSQSIFVLPSKGIVFVQRGADDDCDSDCRIPSWGQVGALMEMVLQAKN